jgi:hypothetical protein
MPGRRPLAPHFLLLPSPASPPPHPPHPPRCRARHQTTTAGRTSTRPSSPARCR